MVDGGFRGDNGLYSWLWLSWFLWLMVVVVVDDSSDANDGSGGGWYKGVKISRSSGEDFENNRNSSIGGGANGDGELVIVDGQRRTNGIGWAVG